VTAWPPAAGATTAAATEAMARERGEWNGGEAARAETGGSSRGVCVVCMEGPREAVIAHGQTAHTVCCMTCAHALKSRGESCPICRAPIDAVLQNFD
jgi:hypothetical protein